MGRYPIIYEGSGGAGLFISISSTSAVVILQMHTTALRIGPHLLTNRIWMCRHELHDRLPAFSAGRLFGDFA